MRFETEHRAHVLTLALQQRGAFARSHQSEQIDRATAAFKAPMKYRWGQDTPSLLSSVIVTCASVEQVSQDGEKKFYHFKDIENLIELRKEADVFALEMKDTQRLHIFSHSERGKILGKIRENAGAFIGTQINAKVLEGEQVSALLERRLGVYSEDEHITSLCEFAVQNRKRARILLCLTETCLLERDPATYCVRLTTAFGTEEIPLQFTISSHFRSPPSTRSPPSLP